MGLQWAVNFQNSGIRSTTSNISQLHIEKLDKPAVRGSSAKYIITLV